jgi:diguanylate cyclase (GGDEF)-like protein/PAS domain S-box-containing protein
MGRSSYRGVTVAAVVLVLACLFAVALALWRLREDAISEAVRETEAIATILAEQVDHSSQAIELVLDELIADVRHRKVEDLDGYRETMRTREVHDHLKERLTRLPQADVITFTDNTGRIVNITRGWPAPDVDLSDRDYFRHFASNRDGGLLISQPVQNKVTGTWIVYFSKRLETTDGQFMGVVMVGFRPEYFLKALDVIAAIPERSLLLLRDDGTVLLRHPDPIVRTGFKMPADAGWYAFAAKGGFYRSEGVLDPIPRWVVVRPTRHYPLVVDVAISESQALEEWRGRALVIGGSALFVGLLFLILAHSLFRQFARLHASEAALCEKTRELTLANARFDATLSSMSNGIAMFDGDGRMLIHNRTYEQIWGLRPEDLRPGTLCTAIIADCTARGLLPSGLERFDPGHPDFVRDASCWEVVELGDGRTVRITRDPMADGGWVSTHEDITEHQRANARIAHLAHYDALTDLANRALFMTQLQTFVGGTHGGGCAVLLIDLDHFKEVNDTFGHGIGDTLLQEAAARLAKTVRSGDLVARLGGDEFAIVCDLTRREGSDEARDEIEQLAARMVATVGLPYVIEGNEISVGLSIGITFAREEENDSERVMRRADLALYRAKTSGRNRFRVFEAAMEEEYDAHQSLIADLQGAISRGEIEVHYQPIVDATTRDIRTMEALARWTHPVRGSVPPSLFIAAAEEAGLIQGLGEWVLTRACLEAATWPETIRVAVNVSPIQIGLPSFPDTVARILRVSGLPARRLQLEITESVLLSDTGRAASTLHALRDTGITIALDDFGTGYSALSYLKRFPFDEIKIDKSFIDDIVGHRGSAAIVSATIALAREFDMRTTAEGVETEAQYELLRATAVTQMQGYLFGRPALASAWNLHRRERAVETVSILSGTARRRQS